MAFGPAGDGSPNDLSIAICDEARLAVAGTAGLARDNVPPALGAMESKASEREGRENRARRELLPGYQPDTRVGTGRAFLARRLELPCWRLVRRVVARCVLDIVVDRPFGASRHLSVINGAGAVTAGQILARSRENLSSAFTTHEQFI